MRNSCHPASATQRIGTDERTRLELLHEDDGNKSLEKMATFESGKKKGMPQGYCHIAHNFRVAM